MVIGILYSGYIRPDGVHSSPCEDILQVLIPQGHPRLAPDRPSRHRGGCEPECGNQS